MKPIYTLLFFLIASFSFAQTQSVNGTVVDENGTPLIAATVKVDGTGAGAITDIDGKFEVEVPSADATLTVTYVGYSPQQIIASSLPRVITLAEDVATLDEVVVVGYSQTTKRQFTGTAVSVDAEKIQSKNTSDVSQALAGEVSGVQVLNTNGAPGKSATIRIRGYGSSLGNREPLYVVDGLPYSGDLSSINPNDIESTTVLKDAAATAIYGNRGANGVVVVTTKSGSAQNQKIRVTANSGTNLRLLPEYDVIKSPETYMELTWQSLYNEGVINGAADPGQYASQNLFNGSGNDRGVAQAFNIWDVNANDLIDPTTGKFYSNVGRKYTPENWEDYVFNKSNRTEANIEFNGGGGSTTFFSSVGALRDKGYYLNSQYERITGRLGVNHQIKPWLKGSVRMNYTTDSSDESGQTTDSNSAFWFVNNIPSIYPLFLRDGQGNKINDPVTGGFRYDYGEQGRGFGAFTNAVGNMVLDEDKFLGNDIGGIASLDASFLQNFYAKMSFRIDLEGDEYTSFSNPFYGGAASSGGSIYKREFEDKNYVFNQMLGYNNNFGDHTIEAFVSHENTDFRRQYIASFKNNIADPYNYNLNNAVVQSPTSGYEEAVTLESYFGQAVYDFQNKYFVTASLRSDGSSRFLKDKWGTFGSVGLAWDMSQEDFFNIDAFDFLKLKGSWGLLGDQGGVPFYSGYNLYEVQPNNGKPALVLYGNPGNPDLTWETSEIWQVGVEFDVFDRLFGSVEYFNKLTKDQLVNRLVGPSAGFDGFLDNDGELKNNGLEFDLGARVVKPQVKDGFGLSFNVNGSVLNNEWNQIASNLTGEKQFFARPSNGSVYGWTNGKGLYEYHMREWAGVDSQTGLPTWYVNYVDLDGNGSFNEGEEIGGEALVAQTGYKGNNLEDFQNENPDMAVKQGVTSVYSQATTRFINKSAIPKVFGGFRLNLDYKGLSLSSNFLYRLGGYGYDSIYAGLMGNNFAGNNNWHTDMLNRWEKPGDVTDVPMLTNETPVETSTGTSAGTQFSSTSSRFLTKADYLSLNNVNLSYQLPRTLLSNVGLSGTSVYVRGDNLFLLSKRDGYNPLTSETGGTSSYRYTPMSTVNAGINFEF